MKSKRKGVSQDASDDLSRAKAKDPFRRKRDQEPAEEQTESAENDYWPEIEDYLHLHWRLYFVLHDDRGHADGVHYPISIASMRGVMDEYGISDWESRQASITIWQSMDRVYREHVSDNRKKEMEASRRKSERGKSPSGGGIRRKKR